MFARKEEQNVIVRSSVQGGKGEVAFRHFLPAESSYNTGRMFAELSIEPGCSIGYHTHSGESEIYYILEGEALVNDDGQQYKLFSGDMMQCKDGSGHSIENSGSSTLRLIAFIIFNHSRS